MTEIMRVKHHKDVIQCLAESADGQYLASSSMELTVVIMHSANLERMTHITGYSYAITALCFLDNEMLAVMTDQYASPALQQALRSRSLRRTRTLCAPSV